MRNSFCVVVLYRILKRKLLLPMCCGQIWRKNGRTPPPPHAFMTSAHRFWRRHSSSEERIGIPPPPPSSVTLSHIPSRVRVNFDLDFVFLKNQSHSKFWIVERTKEKKNERQSNLRCACIDACAMIHEEIGVASPSILMWLNRSVRVPCVYWIYLLSLVFLCSPHPRSPRHEKKSQTKFAMTSMAPPPLLTGKCIISRKSRVCGVSV